jgi:acyl transferase domain-containing protein
VRALLRRAAHTLFVEISPHPVLMWPLHDIIDDCQAAATAICSLRRDRPDMESLLAGLGGAYTAGCIPDWNKVSPDGRFVRLPTYPWTRSTFWVSDTGPAVIEMVQAAADAAADESGQRLAGPQPGQQAKAAVATRPTMPPAGKDARALQCAHLPGTQFREYVLRTISEVLGVQRGEIDAAGTMAGIGMDSLHALRVREKIHAELGLRISSDQLTGGHTVAELSDNWRDRLHERLALARQS